MASGKTSWVIFQIHLALRLAESAPAGLALHPQSKVGELVVGVPASGTFDGSGIGGRVRVAGGPDLRIAAFCAPDGAQLGLAGFRGAVGLLARPALQCDGAHGQPGAVHSQVEGRGDVKLGVGLSDFTLVAGDLLSDGFRVAFHFLGADVHASQLQQQLAAFLKACDRAGKGDHAPQRRRQRAQIQAQAAVARAEALAAGTAMEVGPLKGDLPERGLKDFAAPIHTAGLSPAGAGAGPGGIRQVGIQMGFDIAGRRVQSLLAGGAFQGFKIERAGAGAG